MNTIKQRAFATFMAASVAAAGIAIPFIQPHEGRELVAYQDSVGIWTICDGETVGVREGDIKTNRQCDAITTRRVTEFAYGVVELTGYVPPKATHAAFTSLAYNIGLGNFSKSTALKKLKAHDIAGACKEIGRWVYAKGRDCRIRSNQCYGIVTRRAAEYELCMRGLQ